MAQHDYVIANASGLAVRQDINNALAAVVSNNSGSAAPSTTYAYMWWSDTTTGLLKQRNAANSAWITVGTLGSANLGLLPTSGGTLTGALLVDDSGTAALPAVAFDGDADTGIYRKAANELGVATAGILRAWFDSAGVNLDAQGDTRYWDSDSSNYVAFQAPATVASNVTWTLPSADGASSEALTTNGSGTLSFTGTTCRAWVNFNGTGTVAIRASYNVSSITDNGVGDYTVNFTTALADGNYSACINSGNSSAGSLGAWTVAYSVATSLSSSLRISGYSSAGTAQDQDQVMCAIFR